MHEYIGGRGSGDATHNEQSVTNHITWCYIYYYSLSINYLFIYHIYYWPWERCNAWWAISDGPYYLACTAVKDIWSIIIMRSMRKSEYDYQNNHENYRDNYHGNDVDYGEGQRCIYLLVAVGARLQRIMRNQWPTILLWVCSCSQGYLDDYEEDYQNYHANYRENYHFVLSSICFFGAC